MCLIALAYKVHADFPLLWAANRDEFHARPAAPLAWWPDSPDILAGRDLQEGGTWLGVHRNGRAAAVTNVREAGAGLRRPRSRGALVARFLAGTESGPAFSESLRATAGEFGAFNLLLFDGASLHYTSNRPDFVSRRVEPGVHALSNAQLDTPWPKAVLATGAMSAWIRDGVEDDSAMLEAMADVSPVPDARLPSTGVSLELERVLASPFIRSARYGTRCTSILKLSRGGIVELAERRFDASGEAVGETRERFVVSPKVQHGAAGPAGGEISGNRLPAAADPGRL